MINSPKTFFNYLIYKNYNWQLKVGSKSPVSATASAFSYTYGMLIAAIIYSIIIILDLHIDKLVIGVCALIVYFLIYWVVHKYIINYGIENIVNECKEKTMFQKHLGSFFVTLLTILVIFSPIITAVLLLTRGKEIIW